MEDQGLKGAQLNPTLELEIQLIYINLNLQIYLFREIVFALKSFQT